MATKLRIDVLQGIVDVEGDPELVREIYTDFKARLSADFKFVQPASTPPASGDSDETTPTFSKPKGKRRVGVKKKAKADEGGSGPTADAPKLDKNLDTSNLGAFYGRFAPKNNAEKVLIFLKFMAESLEIERPNTDQVYTCFKATGEKIPKAFAQAFYDTSTKHGYIDFRSSTDLSITIAGENHFSHSLKRKAAE